LRFTNSFRKISGFGRATLPCAAGLLKLCQPRFLTLDINFAQTGSVEFLHLRLCVMSTFVTPSALDTDRVAKPALKLLLMKARICIQKLYLYRTMFMLLSHISSSLGHLFFQVREPALGITYITDIPEPIVLDDLHKIRDIRRYKHQTCRICPMVTDNLFSQRRRQGPCFYIRVSTRDFAVLNDTFFVEQVLRLPMPI
jgi:hypothetical protein